MKKIIIIIGILILLAGAVYLLTQTKPAIRKTATVTLSVKPSVDFTLEVAPAHIDSPLERTIAYTTTVTSVNNFAGDIVFSTSTLPSGFTITMFPSPTLTLGAGETKGIQITIDIGSTPSLIGDYTISITAESTVYN